MSSIVRKATNTIVKIAVPPLSPAVNYAAGDVVGALIDVGPLMNTAHVPILELLSVTVKDKAGQAPALWLYIFRDIPNGTYSDNSPVVWGTADGNLCQGVLDIPASGYKTVAGMSVQTVPGNGMTHALQSDMSNGVFSILIVANGAYNASGESDLILDIVWEVK